MMGVMNRILPEVAGGGERSVAAVAEALSSEPSASASRSSIGYA